MRGKLKGMKKDKVKGPNRMMSKSQKRKQAMKLKTKPPKKGAKLVSVADFIHNEKQVEEEEVVEERDEGEDAAPSVGILKFARNLAHTGKPPPSFPSSFACFAPSFALCFRWLPFSED